MTAEPSLALATRSFARHRLEAVLLGNAAALQGSPVTTLDLDFMFRKRPLNLTKLTRMADDLGAIIIGPYYPARPIGLWSSRFGGGWHCQLRNERTSCASASPAVAPRSRTSVRPV